MTALGFTHPTPLCAATLHRVLSRLDQDEVAAVLGAWAEEVLAASCVMEPNAIALDGKRLRGSHRQGASGTHVLSALSHRLGLTMGQTAVDDKTNEIGAVQTLLTGLVVEGRVFTVFGV